MKKRPGKLTLHRETLRTLTDDRLGAVRGQALTGGGATTGPYTVTCQNSGCYICSGGSCTYGCPETDTTIFETVIAL